MTLHPLCELFPPLEGEEFDRLVADIRENGLHEPIVLLRDQVLDGRNRLRACYAANVEPTYAMFTGDDPATFVLSKNLHRRHLPPGVSAAIVAAAQDWNQAHRRGGTGANQHRSRSATLPNCDRSTTAARARLSGASVRLQGMAERVLREDRELLCRVRDGEISLPKAVKILDQRKAPAGAAASVSANRDAASTEAAARPLMAKAAQSAGHGEMPIAELPAPQASRDSVTNSSLLGEYRDLREQVGGLRFRLGKALVGKRKAQSEARHWKRVAFGASRGGGTT